MSTGRAGAICAMPPCCGAAWSRWRSGSPTTSGSRRCSSSRPRSCSSLLRRDRRRLMAAGAARCRAPDHHAAAGDRQYLPARRADAVGRDVARPRPCGAGHRDPDRRQSAPAVPGGAAGRARRRSISSTFRPAKADRFDAFVRKRPRRNATLERVPMLRGRIVGANGVKAEDLKPSRRRRMGAAERPRAHLYGRNPARLAGGRRRVVEGRLSTGRRWCRWKRGSPTGSGSRSATRSSSTCSAATSPATIANLRAVDWQSLGINFVLVFSPNAFRGAPHTHIATLT